MFKILINDFKSQTQKEVGHGMYYLDAKEYALDLALQYVFAEEGLRYMERNPQVFCKKDALKKGFSIVDQSCELYTKYAVYKKNVNGWILSGGIAKIITFMTVRHIPSPGEIEYVEIPESFRNKFESVLTQLAIEISVYEEKKSE